MAAKPHQVLNPIGGRGRKPLPPREPFSVATRMQVGALSIEELADLAGVSDKKIRCDEERGEIAFVRRGGRTFIPGPVAARYLGLDLLATKGHQPLEASEVDKNLNDN
jgi:hypothetical protein